MTDKEKLDYVNICDLLVDWEFAHCKPDPKRTASEILKIIIDEHSRLKSELATIKPVESA